MPDLPARPDLLQLRHQAKDLLRLAKSGDTGARSRIQTIAERLDLSSAQLTIAREYGFASWPRLKTEVERRRLLNRRDLAGLRSMIAQEPGLATSRMEHWCDHGLGVTPLSYVAMLRFDARRLGLLGEVDGTGATARLLLEAGAAVEGQPGEWETPLMTAASYGDAEVALALIEKGADLEATAAPEAGGVGGGTALAHAAVFGMTPVLDLLVASGAHVRSLQEAAAAGDIRGWLLPDTPVDDRVSALTMAVDHQRLAVIDELLAAGTPVDAVDAQWGRQALCVAAEHGRPASARRLLAHGANPNARDGEGRTPLDCCRPENRYLDSPAHDEVEAILRSAAGRPAG